MYNISFRAPQCNKARKNRWQTKTVGAVYISRFLAVTAHATSNIIRKVIRGASFVALKLLGLFNIIYLEAMHKILGLWTFQHTSLRS